MSFTTRTSYLDSLTTNNNDLTIKTNLRQKKSWYKSLYEDSQRLYMQFLLMTTLYVMEPWERVLIMGIFLCIISLVTYSALVYIPFHIHYLLQSTMPSISTVFALR
ncbi:unnamed protein product [Rotaria sordida]|uniref:Serine palmitoyltransferase small subunit B n=1 Tax=Rotaria sordida TaxID=392033 RepID=A0A814WWV1_9BILA|nr:unnamed protein product [Rotaria sordida]CAF1014810.1 unnamed protein product [Rotaria sordida]CAF1198927.1 unnamed protein product [Rotaria sordida]CAF1206540.1 unnamed protein product [Rotaria sordida]